MFAASKSFATRCLRSFTTSASALNAPASTSKTTATASEVVAKAAAPKATSPPPLPKSYFVERTKSGQLPVYRDIRNGGTRELIIVRKIQGDAGALRTQMLQTYPGTDIRVNERSNQLVLQGLPIGSIRQWLILKGF
ncbi:MAG: mitochondrial large subunit ribosomal protein-domain-containing protein [Benniella sp.]|nr:MAG: mitochondrial large subunit ribosomal protein-domain-containing protein [Benniella sp.]